MELITELIKSAFPIVITAMCTYIVWFLQEDKKVRNANSQGMKEILGYMIDRLFDEIMFQKYVTTEQYEFFENVYKSYHALKGNGTRTHKWEQVQKMNIKDGEAFSPFAQMYFEKMKGNAE